MNRRQPSQASEKRPGLTPFPAHRVEGARAAAENSSTLPCPARPAVPCRGPPRRFTADLNFSVNTCYRSSVSSVSARRLNTSSPADGAGLAADNRWTLLALQLPAQPSNARVKTWRRLQQLGAIPIKHAVYVLPHSAQALEDFAWLRTEIEGVGGQATVFTASAVEDVDDCEIVDQFKAARSAEFKRLLADVAAHRKHARTNREGASLKTVRAFRERLEHERAIDFFAAPGSHEADTAIAALERELRQPAAAATLAATGAPLDRRHYAGRTWVTRPRPGVDRFASAWLIRRFIDSGARFACVLDPAAAPDAIPFDMYESGFRHEGDRCTFEVLALRFHIQDPTVRRLGEIVHNVDLKDDRFRAPQAPTVATLVDGLRASVEDDAALLEQGILLFEALYRGLRPPSPARTPPTPATPMTCHSPLPLVWLALLLSAALDAAAQTRTADELFADQIVEPGLAETERDHSLVAKPELFIQSRFSRGVMKGAEADVNFQMTRIETRWSGRLTERLGAGLEIQFHPALDGAPEELVNDAFVEYYATSRLTVRLGQFIKPFGFDIQQSSADREYPERGIFAGYFFPGQRDRGAMLTWLLGGDSSSTAHTQVYAAVLNGNRFWNDNNDRLDTVLRIRRLIPQRQLAVGASLQIGSQIVPSASDRGNVRIVGLDAQYSVHRVGLRAEWVHGTPPLDAARAGSRVHGCLRPRHVHRWSGGLADRAGDASRPAVYGRFDQLSGDPMTGHRVRAGDIGYRRLLNDSARLSIGYQWKNEPTDNDDAVNARFHVTFGVGF